MVARVTSAGLGLLAFAVAAVAGLLARNPVEVTLSRCILALVLFSVVGWVLGSAAQWVIDEHERKRENEIRERYGPEPDGTDDGGAEVEAAMGEGEPSVG